MVSLTDPGAYILAILSGQAQIDSCQSLHLSSGMTSSLCQACPVYQVLYQLDHLPWIGFPHALFSCVELMVHLVVGCPQNQPGVIGGAVSLQVH